jgi:hypothetical protein
MEDGFCTQRDINVSVLWSFWDISIRRDDTRTDTVNIFTSSFPTVISRYVPMFLIAGVHIFSNKKLEPTSKF